ncbi:MAG: hypothetical protein Q9174_000784 [Haloplaca sp. 1 TL-2023]
MARLRALTESDDELPELATLLDRCAVAPRTKGQEYPGHRSKTQKSEQRLILPNSPSDKKILPKQRPLKVAHVNSLLLPLTKGDISGPRSSNNNKNLWAARPTNNAKKRISSVSSSNTSENGEDQSDHMSDFVVPDSDGDSEEDSKNTSIQLRPGVSSYRNDRENVLFAASKTGERDRRKQTQTASPPCMFPIATAGTSRLPMRPSRCFDGSNVVSAADIAACEDALEEPISMLKLCGLNSWDKGRSVAKVSHSSPPRFKSPSKSPPIIKPTMTPPTSPLKSKLTSPTKRHCIPPSPHRPSIDAFWSQEVINDWNDQWSPQKTPKSNYKRGLNSLEEDGDYLSPCETGRRSPSKTPSKTNNELAGKRKIFNQKKYGLATSFLEELDQTIVEGRIAELAHPTGGIQLVWSKKLQSTAGRANWRREAVCSKNTDGAQTVTKYRHHASIELAEKVIDDEDRLMNTIAHEYCHLLNFMISNVKDNPHGKEFKAWAKKCSTAFAHRGVNVTTKHAYEISYKYVWECSECGIEYKRHSKSIDPSRHSCGKCKAKLIQVKPTPRGEGKGISDYQKFVKEQYARVKKEKPELKMGEIMTVLGKEFRQSKARAKEIVVMEPVELGDVSVCDGEVEDLDSVVKELDSMSLGRR